MSGVDAGLPSRLVAEYRVRFDEATQGGLARASALLGYAVDVAWLHSGALGFPREWYWERGCFWLVRAVEARILGPVHDGQAVTVSTRITGWRRVMARRASEVLDAGGALRALIVIDWVMTDGRTPVRIPPEFARMPVEGSGTFSPLRVDFAAQPAAVASAAMSPRLRELDPMNHANNGVYLDWLEEAVAAAGDEGEAAIRALPRTYRLEYLRPAARGAALVAAAWRDGDGWAHRLAGDDDDDLLRGRLDPEGSDTLRG